VTIHAKRGRKPPAQHISSSRATDALLEVRGASLDFVRGKVLRNPQGHGVARMAHRFCEQVNRLLEKHEFERFVEGECSQYFAGNDGPTFADAGRVFPAADRLLRGYRFGARYCVAGKDEFVPSQQMIQRLLADNRHMAEMQRTAIAVCDKSRDTATSHRLQEILDQITYCSPPCLEPATSNSHPRPLGTHRPLRRNRKTLKSHG
jgi:hypothetical protein